MDITKDMIKTTPIICKACVYGSSNPSENGCNFYLIEKMDRGCPVGWCNKFISGKRICEQTIRPNIERRS